jgi:hypothetical protein
VPVCNLQILSNTTVTATFIYVGRPAVGTSVATVVAAGGRVPVKVQCPRPQTLCKGTVRLTTLVRRRGTHGRERVLTLGTARYSVAGGKTGAVKAQLSRAALELLRSGGSLPVKATFATRNPQGERSTEVRQLVLRLAKPKQR